METLFGTIDQTGVVTETVRLDVNQMPSSDPFAFSYGISRGMQIRKLKNEDKYFSRTFEQIHGSKYRELAQEYLRGFLLGYMGILVKEGTKIRKGMERTYFHLSDNILKR